MYWRPPVRLYLGTHPRRPKLVILTCQINELKRTPCLVHHRAYIRSSSSAQPADAREMRKMVWGQWNSDLIRI